MSRFIEDKDGDYLQVIAESDGALNGVTIAATLRDEVDGEATTHHATVGPVDPRALIEAIKAECELHEDDEVHDEEPEQEERIEEHSALADYWDRRLNVVSQALLMIPDPGKMGGLVGALNGNGVPQKDRVPLALKIARFAADGEREIPGVDR